MMTVMFFLNFFIFLFLKLMETLLKFAGSITELVMVYIYIYIYIYTLFYKDDNVL